MAEVVNLEGKPTLPEDVLVRACNEEFEHIIILGRLKDGGIYQDTSTTDGKEILVLIEQGRFDILHNLFG